MSYTFIVVWDHVLIDSSISFQFLYFQIKLSMCYPVHKYIRVFPRSASREYIDMAPLNTKSSMAHVQIRRLCACCTFLHMKGWYFHYSHPSPFSITRNPVFLGIVRLYYALCSNRYRSSILLALVSSALYQKSTNSA